jgi:hypothetical protein
MADHTATLPLPHLVNACGIRATCSSRDPPVRAGGRRGQRPVGAQIGFQSTPPAPSTAQPPARPIVVHHALLRLRNLDKPHHPEQAYKYKAADTSKGQAPASPIGASLDMCSEFGYTVRSE